MLSLSDLETMYKSKFLDPDIGPKELQNKVQFDIRYYFARRGTENIYTMTNTFKVVTDSETQIAYITRAMDEATKNHKETDNDIISGFMPEMPKSKYCPVQSFLTYKISLTPEKDFLWQKPRMKTYPSDGKGTWYGPLRIGHNPIDSFVTDLAKKCGLGDRGYTNHSLRVTAVASLSRQNFSNKQIMSLTGHKSTSSLAIYQKVNGNEKMRMGFALGYNLLYNMPIMNVPNVPQALPALPQPIAPKAVEQVVQHKENVSENNALVPFHFESEDPFNDISDIDLMQYVSEVQNNELIAVSQKETHSKEETKIEKQVVQKKSSPNIPLMFSTCTFNGNVTINLPK